MSEIYQAKYSFRGLDDISNISLSEKHHMKSKPNSPSTTRNSNDNKNKITSDQLLKLNKCFANMASDVVIRSQVLSVKLEKCNSEPNVSKDIGNETNNASNKSDSSPCQSSKSEHSLAGISNPCHKYLQRSLFLTFEKGDSFEVLSKEEDDSWWAVRALKTGIVGFVPVSFLNHDQTQVTIMTTQNKKEANLKVVSELRKHIADVIGQGEFFPRNMIPEPELCTSGADLEKRNRRNNGGPVAPPLPPYNPEGLIMPRKPPNPVLESSDHKSLHRELLFNQKIGKNVLNQKSELQRALEKHKEHQVKRELEQQKQDSKTALERVIEERAKRRETVVKPEIEEKGRTGEPEFMKIHAKLRARMDPK